jgi:hypothetical protein
MKGKELDGLIKLMIRFSRESWIVISLTMVVAHFSIQHVFFMGIILESS